MSCRAFSATAQGLFAQPAAHHNGDCQEPEGGHCQGLEPRCQRLSDQTEMLAVVRVLKPKIGMGLQALEVDSVSNETFLQWLDVLRKS